MRLDINDLYLVIAQLRVDLNRYHEEHEKLIQFYGGTEDARDFVNSNHLGKYMIELERIVALLENEAMEREEEKKNNEIHINPEEKKDE